MGASNSYWLVGDAWTFRGKMATKQPALVAPSSGEELQLAADGRTESIATGEGHHRSDDSIVTGFRLRIIHLPVYPFILHHINSVTLTLTGCQIIFRVRSCLYTSPRLMLDF